MLRSIHCTYKSVLTKHPLKTQAAQASVLMTVGDLISQTFIEESCCDIERTARYGSLGLFIGPSLHTWFGFLERRIGRGGPKKLLLKVAIDQCCFAPCFIAAVVFLGNTLKGKSLQETKDKLKSHYPDILQANYMLWPWVQLANFSVVPLAYRVPVTQLVAIVWNTYLSWKLNAVKVNPMNTSHVS